MVDMEAHAGGTTEELRNKPATAYAKTAAYDAVRHGSADKSTNRTGVLRACGRLPQKLRYGESPSNGGVLFVIGIPSRRVDFGSGQGKGLSYNNLNDTDAAFELVAEFDELACAIIKHANYAVCC